MLMDLKKITDHLIENSQITKEEIKMKLTKRQLKRIIREEYRRVLSEQPQNPQTIELGTPPHMMGQRPAMMQHVLEGTGLPGDGDEAEVARRSLGANFGDEEWDFSDVPLEQWEAAKPALKRKIGELYNSGYIRYGSW